MKKFLLSCAALAFTVSAFAENVVLFQEDFDWLATETNISTYQKDGKNVSNNVGDKVYKGPYNPQVQTIKNNDGTKSVWDMLTDKGYNMYSTNETQAKKSVGLAQNYLKMAITTYTASLVLPAMPAAGEGMNNVRISFDWTPMTDGGLAIWDETLIAVEVTNGDKKTYFPIASVNKVNGFVEGSETEVLDPYKWYNVDMALEGCVINKDTRIALRNADPDFPQTATTGQKKRWFLDNIKVYVSGNSSVEKIGTEENAPVEYFNLQGVKIANPENGVFIRRQGSKVSKVVMK